MTKRLEGMVREKKAVNAAAAWMNQRPNPLPVFRRGELVEIYRGAGWSKASVIESTARGCSVKILQNDQFTNVYDARCIRPLSSK